MFFGLENKFQPNNFDTEIYLIANDVENYSLAFYMKNFVA